MALHQQTAKAVLNCVVVVFLSRRNYFLSPLGFYVELVDHVGAPSVVGHEGESALHSGHSASLHTK